MTSPYSNRGVWNIAAPMILSNVSLPLLGLVDTAVMGHLDSAVYLGAVAIGATIFSFIFTGLNVLRMGTPGIAAQAIPVVLRAPRVRLLLSEVVSAGRLRGRFMPKAPDVRS